MSFELTIEPLGYSCAIEEDQTLLDAALRNGIYIPHACGHGLCGTCKVKVVEGDVDFGEASPFALMDFEREEGVALACCAKPLSDVVIEAEIDEDPDARAIPLRDLTASIERIEDLTPTIKGVWLRLSEPLPFQAGQYVQIGVPGIEGTRAFSIANAPQEVEATGLLELNIRLVPGGAMTTWFHENAKVGDTLKLTGPHGRFFVRRSANKPVLFLAGGSGLSSPRSMIHDLLATGWPHPITLVYGQRNRAELYYDEEFRTLAQTHVQFSYVPCLSDEPETSNWQGERGLVHEVAKKVFNGQFSGMQAYLCGPPLMIDACITTLMQGRLFEADIFFEKFISAADAQQVRSPLFRKI
ncbi:NADH:ubiquinone reductase (Na(+)-transporting) subunit F [Hydrogenophilus thiooxidans]|uniref:NADH:ubiquinone reductase (Na(+)-transporting) subunit F n=1 Tax=Hydrogenophilus thiooxidans TaxID=2820326 RepID=UPI001C232F8E|nr:2Fe-2S iron-sulfur cluster binding domain-containing protein [Hydrogenophilus thiooxidans]